MRLEDMSPNELRRYADELELKGRVLAIPKPLAKPDFNHISNMCEEHLYQLAQGYEDDGEFKQWLYEAVLEAVFGDDIWHWVNNQ